MRTYVEEGWKESLKDHELRLVANVEEYEVWLMKAPNTRHLLVQIFFSPEGIAIQGDVLFNRKKGLVSDFGYHRGWFGREQSESYLCEKFLRYVFVPEVAAEEIEDMLENPEEHNISKGLVPYLKEIAEELRDGKYGRYEFEMELDRVDYHPDEPLGYGYDPKEASPLCAIQQKFVELYSKLEMD